MILSNQIQLIWLVFVVKIPNHYEIVKAALEAGKHVYCEWPVGSTFEETKELAELAKSKKPGGVVTAVGLQGRNTPALQYIKQLYEEENWFGDIQCVRMTSLTKSSKSTRPSLKEYQEEVHRNASMLNIIGGHELHYIQYCLGDDKFQEISARLTTIQKTLKMEDTGEIVSNKEPDQIMANGILKKSGAVVNVHIGSVAIPPSTDEDSWKMEIYGTKGKIIATTSGMPQITPIKLMGQQLQQGDDELKEMEIPQSILEASKDLPPFGPTTNIGRHYKKMIQAISNGEAFDSDFDTALEAHRLLELIKESNDKGGITIQV